MSEGAGACGSDRLIVPADIVPEASRRGCSRESAVLGRALAALRAGRSGMLVVSARPGQSGDGLLPHLEVAAGRGVRCVRVDAGNGRHNLRWVWERVVEALDRDGSVGDPTQRSVRRPALVIVDQVPSRWFELARMAHHLLRSLEGLPLLVAIGVVEATRRSRPPWYRWAGRHGVPRLHLEPLGDRRVRHQALAALPDAGPGGFAAVMEVACGSPGIARELIRWERGDTTVPPTPLLRQMRTVAPLLTERVCRTEATEVLAALAAARGPAPAALLARALELPSSDVGGALARAADACLVRTHGAGVAFAHPLVRAATTALVGPDRMAALHAAFARLLVNRSDDGVGPAVVDVAEHRLAAGESGPAVLQACLEAAEWSWRQGDLQGTSRWAESGLTMVPDGRVKARLLQLHGLCALRSGALTTGVQDLTTAVRISESSDDGAAHAAITLDLLQARSPARVFDPDTVPLVRGALSRCPVTRPGLRARLVGHLAEAASWQDPAQHQQLAAAAVELARSSGDPAAVAFTRLVQQLAPVAGQQAGTAADLARLTSFAATTPAAARLAQGHAALVTGDRTMLEEVSRDLHDRSDADGSPADGWGAALSAQLQVAIALLDGDGSRVSLAVRHLETFAPPWAEVTSLVGAIVWPGLPGLPDPRGWLSRATPQTPSWLAALRHTAVAVHRATHPVVRVDELAAAVTHLPQPENLAPDVAWSTWLALNARAAALLGDLELCAETAETLQPYAPTFIVLGIGNPIGPAGWFLADALLGMGHTEQALAANGEAERVSARLGSLPWVKRCRAQRAHLLRTGAGAFVRRSGRGSTHPDAGQQLATLRADDLRLLGWVGHGMTNQAIARRLSVSVSTVERRLSSIYRALGVGNRAQAVSLLAALPE